MLSSIAVLLAATAAFVAWVTFFVWMSGGGSRWRFTRIATVLVGTYAAYGVVLWATADPPMAGAGEGLDLLTGFSPFLMIPLLLLTMLIDRAVAAVRRIRSHE